MGCLKVRAREIAMRKQSAHRKVSTIPKSAVLFIPEPEDESELPAYGVKPGYYDPRQMLELIEGNKSNADAIHYIADMLETGDPENDGFAVVLRENCKDPLAIAQIIKICRE
jgi:hypothetical protein